MTDSKALIERLRDYGDRWDFEIHHDRLEAADHIEKLEADKARLDDALRQAVIDAAEWAHKAGEAQGKLEISEAAGILDGWVRDCERLRADNARLREELVQIEVDAMEHYNDWMEHGCEPVEATRFAFDLGQYARAALAGDSHD